MCRCTVAWFNCFGMTVYLTFPLGNTLYNSWVQEILETQEKSKSKSHIWTFRTPEEASYYWNELYGHLDDEPE